MSTGSNKDQGASTVLSGGSGRTGGGGGGASGGAQSRLQLFSEGPPQFSTGFSMLPEGSFWLGHSAIQRDIVRLLPIDMLGRTIDILLDSSLTYPMSLKVEKNSAKAKISFFKDSRLSSLGVQSGPREMDNTFKAVWQPWHGSYEDLAAALSQLVMWKCQGGADPKELEVIGGGSKFYIGLMEHSTSPSIGLLSAKYLQQILLSQAKDTYLNALNWVRRVAEAKESQSILQNPYLLLSTLSSVDTPENLKVLRGLNGQ